MKKIAWMVVCMMVLLCLLTGCGGDAAEQSGCRIGVVGEVRGASMEAGMRRAATELDAELLDFATKDGETLTPADQVRQAVAQKCQAILLVETQGGGLSEALQEAVEAGVQIVCVDTAAEVEAAASFTTDHRAMGEAAARSMLEALETRRVTEGTIGIISAEDTIGKARAEGFREALEGTGYTLLETRYCPENRTIARSAAWQQISQGAVGIYGTNEAATIGAGNAEKDAGTGAVVVGAGQSEEISALMAEGFVRMTVSENPEAMGYAAVKAAAGEGQPVSPGAILLESDAPLLRIQDYKLALIAADSISREGQGLEAGAMAAAAELGCEVVNLSPLFQDEAQQAAKVEEAISEGSFAIIAAAGDSSAVMEALEKAAEQGIVLVCVDSSGVEADVFLSVDAKSAGQEAGEALLAELEKRNIPEGSISIIGTAEDDPEALLQEEGFRAVFAGTAYTLTETQYSGGDAAQAHLLAESGIWKKTVGVFCCGEANTIGAGNAVKMRKSNMLVVGCGASEAIAALVEEGFIAAAIASDTTVLGYEAVKAACAVLQGENPAAAVTNTGVLVG